MQLWRLHQGCAEGGPRHPSRVRGTHGRISRGEGSPCLWVTPSPPWPGSSQVLSPPDCLPVALSFAHRTSGIFHYHVSNESLPGFPRATWTEACLPRSPDGGIPGRSDNRLQSNLLAWNSLPGLSPPGRFPEGGSQQAREGRRGRGTSGPPRPPLEPQGHPATLTRTLTVLGEL